MTEISRKQIYMRIQEFFKEMVPENAYIKTRIIDFADKREDKR